MALVAQVAEIQITTWVTSKSYLNDFETIFDYGILPCCSVYFCLQCHLCHKSHKFNIDRTQLKIVQMHCLITILLLLERPKFLRSYLHFPVLRYLSKILIAIVESDRSGTVQINSMTVRSVQEITGPRNSDLDFDFNPFGPIGCTSCWTFRKLLDILQIAGTFCKMPNFAYCP